MDNTKKLLIATAFAAQASVGASAPAQPAAQVQTTPTSLWWHGVAEAGSRGATGFSRPVPNEAACVQETKNLRHLSNEPFFDSVAICTTQDAKPVIRVSCSMKNAQGTENCTVKRLDLNR